MQNKTPLCIRNAKGRNEIQACAAAVSFIRTLTVGFGITPNQHPVRYRMVAGCTTQKMPLTAGGEFHPALKQTSYPVLYSDLYKKQDAIRNLHRFSLKNMVLLPYSRSRTALLHCRH